MQKKSLLNSTVYINIKYNIHELISQVIPQLTKQWDNEYKSFGKPWHLEIKKNIKEIGPITTSKLNSKIITRLRLGVLAGLNDTKYK